MKTSYTEHAYNIYSYSWNSRIDIHLLQLTASSPHIVGHLVRATRKQRLTLEHAEVNERPVTNGRSRHTAHCGLLSAEFDRSPRRPRRRAQRWRRSATSSLSIIAMCARKSIRSRTHIVCHDHAMQTRLGNCWSTRTIGVDCVLLSFAKRNRSYHSRDSICYLSTTTRKRTKSSTSRL